MSCDLLTNQVNIHFKYADNYTVQTKSVCAYLTLCFVCDQQLHPERDAGAGHPAGPKPRSATSLHHAGH